MVSDTSLMAYMDVMPSLGEKQMAVYALLKVMPAGMTNAEIARALCWPINTVTPRTLELRSYGLVKDNGIRACSVTGRNAHAWKVNL
jgi:hypothetical protein